MTTFTQDWSAGRTYWGSMFEDYGMVRKPNLHFLEIGCFEGRTTVWLLENILTAPSSTVTVIDTFSGSDEFAELGVDGESRGRFDENTERWADRVYVLEGESQTVLRDIPAARVFDFVYVDGSHHAPDVLTDAVLAWPLLKPGGVMVFDDYQWEPPAPYDGRDLPHVGVDAFVAAFAPQLVVRMREYQLVVEKL